MSRFAFVAGLTEKPTSPDSEDNTALLISKSVGGVQTTLNSGVFWQYSTTTEPTASGDMYSKLTSCKVVTPGRELPILISRLPNSLAYTGSRNRNGAAPKSNAIAH
jgi:hypothetical protein